MITPACVKLAHKSSQYRDFDKEADMLFNGNESRELVKRVREAPRKFPYQWQSPFLPLEVT